MFRGRVSRSPKRATPLRYLIILRQLPRPPPQGADRPNFVFAGRRPLRPEILLGPLFV